MLFKKNIKISRQEKTRLQNTPGEIVRDNI